MLEFWWFFACFGRTVSRLLHASTGWALNSIVVFYNLVCVAAMNRTFGNRGACVFVKRNFEKPLRRDAGGPLLWLCRIHQPGVKYMKKYTKLVASFAISIAAFVPSSFAQLSVPSDGSDGALNITTNTVIDLTQAATGTWTEKSSGNGIYDPVQWAVVFKYSVVNISNGATVTFANHYANPPLVWLVQSNVTINGTVSVNGNNGTFASPAEFLPVVAGPGGFRGGAYDPSIGAGDGLGPGGGTGGNPNATGGNATGSYESSYGNSQILPLVGGSGASSIVQNTYSDMSGGSGAGAILVVAGGTVTVNGQITALPGESTDFENLIRAEGAGGGIRVVANQLAGSGTIDAAPQGRTRMEANSISQQLNITPNTDLVAPGSTPTIFPSTNATSVSIVSVGGLAAPSDPQANVTSTPDIGLQTNNPVTVVLQTQNFPTTGTVAVRVVPIYSSSWVTNATFASGNATSATWQLTAQIPLGYCVLQAHATSP
jgi:hypothetical protein